MAIGPEGQPAALDHHARQPRGHYRGRGFEFRTDAYGAIRVGTRESDPAGDNAVGMALLKQAATLAESFSNAAKTHQTTALASGEAISWQAGQDLQIASGQQLRLHTGQSIGVLAGAVKAGQGAKGTGLTMIAGQGEADAVVDVLMRAQIEPILELSFPDRHPVVEQHIKAAREWGLKSTADFSSYSSLALLLGPQFDQERPWKELSASVKGGRISMQEALRLAESTQPS